MSTPRDKLRETPWREVGLATLALLLGLAACTQVQPASEGERCASDQPCAKGLRCSFKKKRCFRPVDCDALAKRLQACTRELVETFAPEAKKLSALKRAKLIPRVQARLSADVVEHCRFDAATHKSKKGTKPPKPKSWGEDTEALALNGCITKGPCAEFARCALGVAGVLDDRQKDPAFRAVFPIELERPLASPDAGAREDPAREPPTPPSGAVDGHAPTRNAPARSAPARQAPARDAPARSAPAR